MIMPSFSTFNGIPCTVNSWLLKDLLRNYLKFNGVIISDYSSIVETIAHSYSTDKKDAAKKAIKSTVDIDMMTDCYLLNLKDLVLSSIIPMNYLDDSVFRVLNFKNKLGLFENPYGNTNSNKEKSFILSKDNLELARKYTSESLVLLENKDNILPLNKNSKIALIGPYSDNVNISGSWSIYNKNKDKTITVKQGLLDYLELDDIPCSNGCPVLPEDELNTILSMEGIAPISYKNKSVYKEIQEAISIVQKADIIILAIGEHYKQSGEGASRSNIEIPKIQQDLLDALYTLKKPIVALVFSGRPLALKSIVNKVSALLWVGFPGTEGGHAICDLLFGRTNPSR